MNNKLLLDRLAWQDREMRKRSRIGYAVLGAMGALSTLLLTIWLLLGNYIFGPG